MNKTLLTGRNGKDPEIRTFEDGTKCANLSIAVSESYKDKAGEYQTKTDWFSCVAYRHTAEFIEKHIKQGDRISIVGKLKQRTWTDKEGNNRSMTEVLIEQIEKWDWEKKGSQEPKTGSTVNQDEPTDDLPF